MMDKQYKETAEYLAKRVTGNPETAIILGSGLGSLAEQRIHDGTGDLSDTCNEIVRNQKPLCLKCCRRH